MDEIEAKITYRRFLHVEAERSWRAGMSANMWLELVQLDYSGEAAVIGEKELNAIVCLVWVYRRGRG